MHILNAMYEAIPEHRADLKPHAPRIEQMIIDREFIGAIIGPGGKIIQEIQRVTGAEINIEEVGDNGIVKIFSNDGQSLTAAKNWIKGIVAVPEVGEVYESTVKSIMPYGAFVEFMPGKQGLLHISEVSWKRLDTLEGVLAEGEVIKVKLLGIDAKTGKFRLSRKALMEKPAGYVERPERPEGERKERRDNNGRNGDKRGPRPEHRGPRGPRPEGQEAKPQNNEANTADDDLML